VTIPLELLILITIMGEYNRMKRELFSNIIFLPEINFKQHIFAFKSLQHRAMFWFPLASKLRAQRDIGPA